jgi:hypothetical protein
VKLCIPRTIPAFQRRKAAKARGTGRYTPPTKRVVRQWERAATKKDAIPEKKVSERLMKVFVRLTSTTHKMSLST